MIKNLDNTEISLVYYQFKDYLQEIDNNLEKGYTTKKLDIDTPDGISVQPFVVVKISQVQANALRQSLNYTIARSIVDKLRPVVEMIEEAEPNIKKEFDNENE
jgi:hypothetical protein